MIFTCLLAFYGIHKLIFSILINTKQLNITTPNKNANNSKDWKNAEYDIILVIIVSTLKIYILKKIKSKVQRTARSHQTMVNIKKTRGARTQSTAAQKVPA